MITQRCPQSDETFEAVRSGRWSDALRQHLKSCDVCLEGLWLAGVQDLAGELQQQAVRRPTLDATTTWWKGRAAARAQFLAGVQRPFVVVQMVCLGLGLLVTAALVARVLFSTTILADARGELIALPFMVMTIVMGISSILSLRLAK